MVRVTRWGRVGEAGTRRIIRSAAVATVGALAFAGLLPAGTAFATPSAGVHSATPAAPKDKVIPFARVAPRSTPRPKAPAPFDPTGHTALPAAGTAVVNLAATSVRVATAAHPSVPVSAKAPAATAGDRVEHQAGTLPVWLTSVKSGGAAQVKVTVASQAAASAAGVHGVLMTLQAEGAGGKVGVRVDPSSFRFAYGGDFAARLHLVELPSCALTTPALPACQRQTPLAATAAGLQSAQVTLEATAATGPAAAAQPAVGSKSALAGEMVLADTSSASGSSGSYSATSLSPGGTWSNSGNSGGFEYSYPISTPPAIGGLAPQVGLSYSSASQDARTEGTNNQSSWVGDGWDTNESYVERTYESCSDDSSLSLVVPANDGDECWDGQQLTLSLNGSSTAIVDDGGTLRLAQDSSTTSVKMLTGASNGTADGEYFEVTESGVQYYFGMNHLPGWTTSDAPTQSAWTVPVYEANSGVSACPSSTTFASTSCVLPWRLNLDYVVDTHGNAMAYYYTPETNYYGADMANTAVAYTRGGTLTRIDYGMTSSSIYSATAPEQVLFTATAERCISGVPVAANTCADSQFTTANAAYWPDVPIDLDCAQGSSCTNHGPSFWSRKRLTQITTQIQSGGGTQQVDKYALTQSFPNNGDNAPTLWLDSIQHTGLDTLGGTSTATPPTPSVSFDPPQQLANRVGTIPNMPLMYHNRIGTITSESGAQTTVTYTTPDCSSVPAYNPADPTDTAAQGFASTNTTDCFPVYWTPAGQSEPWLDWFYTHPVQSVETTDLHNTYADGSYPETFTSYKYFGPAWHYDDNPVVKAKNRTWGQFRGFAEVDTSTGDPTVFHKTNGVKVYDQQALSKSYYFQGMNGDTLPNSGIRAVPNLTSHDGSNISVADSNPLSGELLETDNYTNATSNTVNQSTVTVPTVIGPTASQTLTGLPVLTANMVRTAKTLTSQAVSYGTRRTETDTFYNTTLGQTTTGMPVQSDDRGEIAASGNTTRCTFTNYLSNSSVMLALPAEVTTTDQDCSTSGATPGGNLLSDVRTSYDNKAFATDATNSSCGSGCAVVPTVGNPTEVQKASASTGATATAFVVESTATYDSYGRVISSVRTPDSTAPNESSLAQTTQTLYVPASGAPPTTVLTDTQVTPGTSCPALVATTTSTAACEVTSETLDPARAQPVAKVSAAGLKTTLVYDGLGRLTSVWLPNESQSAGAPASMTYSYTVSQAYPSVTATNTLLDNGSYSTSETLYDAMQQPIQTQATAENGSTLVSDTQYDSHGWTVATDNSYAVGGNPGSTLVSTSGLSMPDTTITDHDAMGRATQVTEEHDYIATWTTETAYTGDTTTVLPNIPYVNGVLSTTAPTGAVATTTKTDARGQKTELDQYTNWPTITGTATGGFTAAHGTSTATTYSYNAAGQQVGMTGPDKSAWSFGYDLLGRKTSEKDPDAGSSIDTYDDAGNQVTSTDARGIQLDYTYDLLGRKLTGTDASTTPAFEFASWLYDTLQIGLPTSSTSYVSGVTGGYTETVTGYTSLGKPTGTKITLPASEAPLPSSYTTSYTYTPNVQLLSSTTDPRTTGMAGETVNYQRDALGNPTVTSSSLQTYIGATAYTNYGEPSQVTYGPTNNTATATYSYDDQTRHLTNTLISRTQAPGPAVDNTSYTYDAAGNLTSDTDQQSETGTTVTDQQCYTYDTLDRLVAVWTATDNCAAAPAAGTNVATTAGSYWQAYSYDAIGDRFSETDYNTTTGTGTKTTYVNGCTNGCNASGAQPHTLTATTGGTNPSAFSYDVDGNLATRTSSTGGQKLVFNDEGSLTEVDTTNTAGATTAKTQYVYDAAGNELIRRDPTQTTLFTGDTEIVVNTAVTPNVLLGAVRTYTAGGAGNPVAVRSSLTGGGLDYEFTDPHGTATLEMDTTTQKVGRQEFTPYGSPRASADTTAWVDPTRSYLDKAQDTITGYTDVGARKYDPTLGRFISDDPELETTDPQQLGGYAYAADNPTTGSDPTGLRLGGGPDGDECSGSASEVDTCEGQAAQQQAADGQPCGGAGSTTSNDGNDCFQPVHTPGNTHFSDFMDRVGAAAIEDGWFGAGYWDAAEFFDHYMNGNGSDYHFNALDAIDLADGSSDLRDAFWATVQQEYEAAINEDKKTFSSGWEYQQFSAADSLDWYFALRGCNVRISGEIQPDGLLSLRLQIDSRYQFQTGQTAHAAGLSVDLGRFAQLARDGQATPFLVYGDGSETVDPSTLWGTQ